MATPGDGKLKQASRKKRPARGVSTAAPKKRNVITSYCDPITGWFKQNGHPNYNSRNPNKYWNSIKEVKAREAIVLSISNIDLVGDIAHRAQQHNSNFLLCLQTRLTSRNNALSFSGKFDLFYYQQHFYIDSRASGTRNTNLPPQWKKVRENSLRSRRQLFSYELTEKWLSILKDSIASEVYARLLTAGAPTTRAAELCHWLESNLEKGLEIGVAAVAAGKSLPPIDLTTASPWSGKTIDHTDSASTDAPSTLHIAHEQAKTMLEPTRECSDDKRPLPQLPYDLTWPTGDYGDSPEAKGAGNAVSYLERVWLPILEAGRKDGRIYVDRRIISDHYPGVIYAIQNYQKRNQQTGERKEIPQHLRFPTLKEVNNLTLAAHSDVARIAANRARKGMPIFGA